MWVVLIVLFRAALFVFAPLGLAAFLGAWWTSRRREPPVRAVLRETAKCRYPSLPVAEAELSVIEAYERRSDVELKRVDPQLWRELQR